MSTTNVETEDSTASKEEAKTGGPVSKLEEESPDRRKLRSLLERHGIDLNATPVDSIHGLQKLFSAFDDDHLAEEIGAPRPAIESLRRYFNEELRSGEPYDVRHLARLVSLDPDVIRSWNKAQLHLFAMADFDSDLVAMFQSPEFVDQMKLTCLQWGRKLVNEGK